MNGPSASAQSKSAPNDTSLDRAPERFQRALEKRGFEELTEVQAAVLDPELVGRDLRIASQTGSGKTVALGFVVSPHLQAPKPERAGRVQKVAAPKVVLVAPTRELAAQLGRELSWLYGGQEVRSVVVTGGTPVGGDLRAFRDQPDLLIGTPGRIVDHLQRGALSFAEVGAIVLDEADELLDMGFRDELDVILAATPDDRQTHLVSATFPEKVDQLAQSCQKDALMVQGTVGAHGDIDHVAMIVRPSDRAGALVNLLLRYPDHRHLVFVRTRVAASGLAGDLAASGFLTRALSGEMVQRERNRCLAEFRAGRVQCLVATDVAARGLDIRGVQRIVHYDLPTNRESFTHRSGRTGRAGEQGESVLLVPPSARRRVQQQMRSVGVDLEWRQIPDPEEIREAARERLVRRFGDPEATRVPEAARSSPDLRSAAQRILAQREAEDVVVDLLQEIGGSGPTDPVPLPRGPRKEEFEYQDKRGAKGGKKNRDPRREPSSDASRPGYTKFHVSWGTKGGATPSRLMAHVCRRGGITGDAVGEMRLFDFRSVVEVADERAQDFEQAVRRPDPRNPKVRIARWEPRATSPSARSGRPSAGERGSRGAQDRPGTRKRGKFAGPQSRRPRRDAGKNRADSSAGRRGGGEDSTGTKKRDRDGLARRARKQRNLPPWMRED